MSRRERRLSATLRTLVLALATTVAVRAVIAEHALLAALAGLVLGALLVALQED